MYGYAYGFLPMRLLDNNGDGGGSNSDTNAAARRQGKKDDERSIAAQMSSMGRQLNENSAARAESIRPVQYRKGGKVRKTGRAIVHKNERVIPASKRKKAEKVMRKAGMKLTNKKRGKKRKAGRSGGRS